MVAPYSVRTGIANLLPTGQQLYCATFCLSVGGAPATRRHIGMRRYIDQTRLYRSCASASSGPTSITRPKCSTELNYLRSSFGRLITVPPARSLDPWWRRRRKGNAMTAQKGWTACARCCGLFFGYDRTQAGICPQGGPHTIGTDDEFGNYELDYGGDEHPPWQGNWRFCSKCYGLFFQGRRNPEACSGGGAHDASESGLYIIARNVNPPTLATQSNWRHCKKCRVLFFLGRGGTGRCAGGGGHEPDMASDYELSNNAPNVRGQHGWRFCSKCYALCFIGRQDFGACPAGGPHDTSRSGDYALSNNDPSASGDPTWRFCKKCTGLFSTQGRAPEACPAGDIHDGTRSGNYHLIVNDQNAAETQVVPPFQPDGNWRFCRRCMGLFWLNDNLVNACPVVPPPNSNAPTRLLPHDDTGSGKYLLRVIFPPFHNGGGTPPPAGGGPTQPTRKTATYAFPLTRGIQYGTGYIPYTGSFGQGISGGRLISLRNPDSNQWTVGTIELEGVGGNVSLAVGASTTPDDVMTLFGSKSPDLQANGVTVTAIFVSYVALQYIFVEATYSYLG
jgi:hypothetical protein